MKIGIVDYDCGNLFSLKCSFNKIGVDAVVCNSENELYSCDKIVLPGVGAFADAIKKLNSTGLGNTVKSAIGSVPLLGICLGMQLLFSKSFEYGDYSGLKLINGNIVPLKGYIDCKCKIPQMGWNSINIRSKSDLFKYTADGEYMYFVHSYYAQTDSRNITATTDYGGTVTAAVQNGNIFGVQFHPEKSGEAGLKILKAFSEL